MSFLPIQIAKVPGFGFLGGPEFQTTIVNLANGREKRNGDWSSCRHKYTVPFNAVTPDAYLAIKRVFLLCHGRLHSFLHKDWADCTATDEPFGTGDGVTTSFQLRNVSTVAGTDVTYERTITKPDAGVTAKVGGVAAGIAVDTTTGIVTFASAPANGKALTWSGTFYVPVRFDIDYLPFSLDDKSAQMLIANGSIDLIEVPADED